MEGGGKKLTCLWIFPLDAVFLSPSFTVTPVGYFSQYFIMKNFKYTAMLKEFYREQSYTHCLDSTINLL